jgi:hypothetical protein
MSPKEKLAHAKQALACLVEADKLMKIVNKPVDKGGHGCKHLTHGWGKAPQCTRRVTWARQNAVKWVAQCEAELAAHRARMEREHRERVEREEREREALKQWQQKQNVRDAVRTKQELDAVNADIQASIARRAILRKKLYGIDVNTDMEVQGD